MRNARGGGMVDMRFGTCGTPRVGHDGNGNGRGVVRWVAHGGDAITVGSERRHRRCDAVQAATDRRALPEQLFVAQLRCMCVRGLIR